MRFFRYFRLKRLIDITLSKLYLLQLNAQTRRLRKEQGRTLCLRVKNMKSQETS
jgi:hypothetical protein